MKKDRRCLISGSTDEGRAGGRAGGVAGALAYSELLSSVPESAVTNLS